ncbi:MAG: hypothetical protein ACTSP4_08860, partial [Candidatus Hodarchaeales archaeon]
MHLSVKKFPILTILFLSLFIFNIYTSIIVVNPQSNQGMVGDVENGENNDDDVATNLEVVNKLHSDRSVFNGGEIVYVSGKVNLSTHRAREGGQPIGFDWFLPCQKVYVENYLSANDTYIILGMNVTSGSDSDSNGVDDITGLFDDPSVGNFNISFQIPVRDEWDNYGLSGGVNTLRVHYYGNRSDVDVTHRGYADDDTKIPIEDEWNVEEVNITLAEDAVVEASAFSQAEIAQIESTTIEFTTLFENTVDTIANVDLIIDLLIDTGGNNWEANSSDMGITFSYSTGSSTTGGDGVLNLTVQTSATTPKREYMLNVTADYYPAFSGEPDYIVEDASVNATFTVKNPVTYAELIFLSGSPSDATVRPGQDNRSFILRAQARFDAHNGTTVYLEGITITYQLLNETATDVYATVTEAATSTEYTKTAITDSNGEVSIDFNSSYNPDNINLQRLMLNITADFTSRPELADPPNYISTTHDSYLYNLTIDQIWDHADIGQTVITPSNGDRPELSTSWAVFEFRIDIDRSVSPFDTYILENIPVNATLDGVYPGIEVHPHTNWIAQESGTLPGYFHTNLTGWVAFNVSSVFPDTYLDDVVIRLVLKANFTDPNNIDFRFVRNQDGSSKILQHTTSTYSIDPDYDIGTIIIDSYNATEINPGEAVNITFLVRYHNDTSNSDIPLDSIPVNITYTHVTGITHQIDTGKYPLARTGYYYTKNGYISLILKTTYGVIAESLQTISLTATADFENDSSSDYVGLQYSYLVGEDHAGLGTWVDYNTTWSDVTGSFDVNPDYTEAIVECISDTANIRPGDWAIITFRTRYKDTSTVLANVPVEIISSGGLGVTLTLVNNTNMLAYGTYVRTNSSGLIAYNVSTTYGVSPVFYPKTLTITLNATANYTSYGETYFSNRWLVGDEVTSGMNQSQSSFDTLRISTELGEVDVDANYFYGVINFIGFNTTSVQQTEGIAATFEVVIQNNQAAVDEGAAGNAIEGITVHINMSIINYWNLTVIGGETAVTDASGSVTFHINTSTDTEQDLPIYIGVYADFENDTAETVSGHPAIKYYWLNGTSNELDGKINATYTSINSTSSFSVTNNALINTEILKTYFANQTVYSSGEPWLAMRSSIVTIRATYKEAPPFLTPIVGETLSIYLNDSSMDPSSPTDISTSVTGSRVTDAQGQITINITIPNTIRVEDIRIHIDDNARADEQNSTTILRVMGELQLSVQALEPQGGQAFVQNGNTVTFRWSVTDDLSRSINSSNFLTSIVNEVNNTLYLRARNSTGHIINTLNSTATIDGSSSGFHIFTVPGTYLDSTITFQLLANDTDHFYGITTLQDGITARTQNVYQDIVYDSLSLHLNNGTTIDLSSLNDTVYFISGTNLTNGERIDYTGHYLTFTLHDNYGRGLESMDISLNSNGSITTPVTGTAGAFTSTIFTIAPSDANNDYTFTFYFQHVTNNGTNFELRSFTFNWKVVDVADPSFTLTNENEISTRYFYENLINFTLNIADASGNYVTFGINSSVIEVYINDVHYTNISDWDGVSDYVYQLDVSAAGISLISNTIKFIVYDNAGNSFSDQFSFSIDSQKPVHNSYTIIGTTSGNFITGTITIIINATDDNIDEGSGLIAIQSTDKGNAVALTFNSTDSTFYYILDTTTITGDIDFTYWVSDLGGREMNSTITGAKTVDNTEPSITIADI